MPRHALQLRAGEPVGPLRGFGVREVQARGGGAVPGVLCQDRHGAPVLIYRFPNLYGKWCRPQYNSAVATFCDAVANGSPYTVNDPSVELELLYIDDLVGQMLGALLGGDTAAATRASTASTVMILVVPTDRESLGGDRLLLDGFRDSRNTLAVPDLAKGSFSKRLWSTFLIFYEPGHFAYSLRPNTDARGSFTEFLRTPERGQVSINVSRPGVAKGNHWHLASGRGSWWSPAPHPSS